MAMPNKLPREQRGDETEEMTPQSTYRSARPAGDKVVPLHRRLPHPPEPRHERSLVQSVEHGQCIQRAYYLEARKGFSSDAALADAMGVHRSQVTRWAPLAPRLKRLITSPDRHSMALIEVPLNLAAKSASVEET